MEKEQFSYKLEVFEGPLDLLLHLIHINKINLYDIPVAQLLDQYMEHIRKMQEADIDIASEFLTMASRLVYLKTVMLLPKQEEEAEVLKRELVGELINYQLACEAAGKLAAQANFDQFTRDEMVIEADKTYRLQHDSMVLYNAYIAAAGRERAREKPSKETFTQIVAKPVVSVNARIIHILKRLYRTPVINAQDLFIHSESKSEAVATFLAVLELLRYNRVKMDDDANIQFSDGGERHWKRKRSTAQ